MEWFKNPTADITTLPDSIQKFIKGKEMKSTLKELKFFKEHNIGLEEFDYILK